MKAIAVLATLLAFAPAGNVVAGDVNVAAYTKRDQFTDLKISPNGDYLAATVPMEDRTVLVVIDKATDKIIGNFAPPQNNHVDDFRWVNPQRLLIGLARKYGSLENPMPTGELFAMNADGSAKELLLGQRIDDGGLGTHIKPKKDNEKIWGFPVDVPGVGDRTTLISAQKYASDDPYSSVERLDLYSGRMLRIASAPIRNARFATDNQGRVRFAWGSGTDNVRHLFYRADDDAAWETLRVEQKDGLFEYPVGFSADDATVYLRVEQPNGPDAIVTMDLATRKRTEVLRDDDVDPADILYRNGTRIPVGVRFIDGRPRTAFFDPASQEARLQRSLEGAFQGDAVEITSQTSDGSKALVQVYSDRNPGDFYLFDVKSLKAAHVLSRRQWFDPEQQATMKPVTVRARDGLMLHGYVTTPKGSDGKTLPMVVLPHGGPFGVQDAWGFDTEAQMLAAAGYAVLQLNYRGSGGYGQPFQQAGGREWGGKMQDDLTDATHWAIAEGIADAKRVCLYGGSYGGYASLMGVAKEPDLYRCAVGYVGVYDLPKMQADDKRTLVRWGNWSQEWVGRSEDLGAVSPNRLAQRIKVPVFLAAGGEDERAPIEHSRMMERALRSANVPVETLYYPNEGHGFFIEEHRREFYTRLLAFLSKNLGGGVAATGGGTAEKGAK
ncbi:S9 family peptidase [Lysobacter sp. LF1]|uniref:S9 family peptidase n=1 Tax=Lysobacter stagni TaxID=3045172 RepID=A0ABT6XL06_9GAMM|nr:S9 family peptidase [Lysobacter sp. LF1]MDI9240832.1 S9 family peptidase [Lysobacter sp. LF1]